MALDSALDLAATSWLRRELPAARTPQASSLSGLGTLDRPVLVIGAPRSGKSLIGNVLRAAEEFCVVGEALGTWNLGMKARADDRRFAEEATPRCQELIARSCLGHMKGAEKTRYLDNLAYNALRVPFLRAIFPTAKVIFALRDARGAIPEMLHGWTAKASLAHVARRTKRTLQWRTLPRLALRFARNYAASRLDGRRSTWGPVVPGLRDFAATHSASETAAFQWLRLNQIALADLEELPASAWMQVRFEDLIRDPADSFARIAAFAEVEDPEAVVRYSRRHVDPDNVPRLARASRVEPTPEEWKGVHRLIDELQEQLGYGRCSPRRLAAA